MLGRLFGGQQQHAQGGRLLVNVVEAKNLARKDILSKSDPYVVLSIHHKHDFTLFGSEYKSSVITNNQNPVWNQSFTLDIKNPDTDLLRIRVYDYDHLSFDDLIGTVDIPVFNLCMNTPKDDWYQLHPSSGGTIHLTLTAQGFGKPAQYPMAQAGGYPQYAPPMQPMPPMGQPMMQPYPPQYGYAPAPAPAPVPYGYPVASYPAYPLAPGYGYR